MEVFVLEIQELNEGVFENLLTKVSPEKANRIRKFVFKQDAHRVLCADLFIRSIIMQQCFIENAKIEFKYNSYGKPQLIGHPGFHFNISHSGNWIVCAVDNQPIGIDIEMLQDIDLQIADRFFSTQEVIDLYQQDRDSRTSYFFDLWTLKESYIKMLGKGLSIPLDSFSIRLLSKEIVFISHQEREEVFLKKYDFHPEYKLAVCAMHKYISEDFNVSSFQKMIQIFNMM
ncbi:4'-phosphopantetheinyl transferase superfamily protein [Paenibacillus albiflavus]|uniref:4'-phosphopantetheinyl transferase superfamily protein n=1 Tax=Paenibacillus albiflavus TaxID=2545760 RepID=A0A4R4ELT6_9BACL|nr:4'-phosphopantetheinyl transferase superfamily protein [Paenibacillus albiflavus]TCZ80999.1 4'-phosphopantetheinyl transferase superfamily protein [Paenibacillus albiflavus]